MDKNKIFRYLFAFAGVFFVLLGCVSPASASGLRVDEYGKTQHRAYLNGSVTVSVNFGDLSSDQYATDYDIGGFVPTLPNVGANYESETIENYHQFETHGYLDYSLTTEIDLSRRKRTVDFLGTSYNFDRIRYDLSSKGYYHDSVGELDPFRYPTFFKSYTFSFEPVLLKYDADFFNQLFVLRLWQKQSVEVYADVAFRDDDGIVVQGTYGFTRTAGNPNIENFSPFSDTHYFVDNTGYPFVEGTEYLFSNIRIVIAPNPQTDIDLGSYYLNNNGFSFELLSAQYANGTPPNVYETPVETFISGGGTDIIIPEIPDFSVPEFFQWMIGPTGAILDLELAPGFNIGAFFWIVICLAIILWMLKVMAGG